MNILQVKNENGEWVGIRAIQGPQGDTGAKGDDGATFTPTVDGDGNLSWTNNKDLTNPTTINIRGPQGIPGTAAAKGDKGDPGPQGPQGNPGRTPVKGVDYFTTADKQEIVNSVISGLPIADEVGY